jgi:hypothetical protein
MPARLLHRLVTLGRAAAQGLYWPLGSSTGFMRRAGRHGADH